MVTLLLVIASAGEDISQSGHTGLRHYGYGVSGSLGLVGVGRVNYLGLPVQ